MKRLLRAALSLLIALGLAIALWPLGQAAYARWSQNSLRAAWHDAAAQTRTGNPLAKGQRPERQKPLARRATRSGGRVKSPPSAAPSPLRASLRARRWPLTRVIAPDIGLDAVVVPGVDEASLRRGPGHWPGSALPGQPGNCVIAAHRNVYGSWLYRVDELLPGSLITLRTPEDSFDYQVVQSSTIADTDTSILQPHTQKDAPSQLTLITCTMQRTTTRIVIVAQLVPSQKEPY